jgi:hypothetical protein
MLGPEHPETLRARHELAHWIGEAGDPAEARDRLAELLPIREGVLGPEHPETLITWHVLAFWTVRKGDPNATLMALIKSSQQRGDRAESRWLDPVAFVDAATDLLKANQIREAADIFATLVELRPTDGEALNNLGFCLLPLDPTAALEALQR